jgi:CheY-like chemotaxis protein
MSRVLLADDSPHAQRMGEWILREEGFEVVTVTDGETALVRLPDVDPDVILADVSLPQRSGYEICRRVKSDPKLRHTRVVLTAGALEPLDEQEALRVQADATLRKPFEASVMIETVRPLILAAEADREAMSVARVEQPVVPVPALPEDPPPAPTPEVSAAAQPAPEAPPAAALEAPPEVDPERVRAAVTLALDAAFPSLVEEITEKVLLAFRK